MATVVAAVDTLLKSADIAAIRTNIGLAAVGNGESIGWSDALLTRIGAGHIGNANRMTHSVAGAASAPAVAVTGGWFTSGNATTTKPQLLIEASGATSTGWGTAGTGLGVNAASGFAGNLIDAQVNGAYRFIADYNGGFWAKSTLYCGGTFGNPTAGVNAGGLILSSGGQVSWSSSSGSAFAAADLILLRDAANTLAQRNGTNAQAFNIYNTYTSGSVYERMFARYSVANSRYEIGTEHVGASARALAFMINGTAHMVIGTTGVVSNSLIWTGLTVGSANTLGWQSSGSYLFGNGTCGAVTGAFRLLGGGSTTALNFGGDSSSFPSIKRSSTILQARLADDSDFCNIQGKLQTDANAVAETPTATHTLLLRDAAGTTYKVLCVAA